MHELAIAHDIMTAAIEQLETTRAERIQQIHCRIGCLAGIDIQALEFCFPFVIKGSTLEGAKLVITQEPAQGECPACKTLSEIHDFFEPCSACGHWPLQLTGGHDMLLTSIDFVLDES
ncbi:hydrogenase maturation nickel metallochaperone HypA [bacterium]|nr:hydrogenase maturation nickel metallochaperone HypA [bacterium]